MAEGNTFVQNFGLNPAVNFNFMLRVEGVMDVPCKSVHSFTKQNEYEYIQEGGLNDYVHMKRKPISQPFTFQVERYVGVDYIDPLPNGAELVLPLLLFVSRTAGSFGNDTVRCYTFTGCTVMGKQFGELQSEQSGLLTETMTIAYRELLVVDVPLDDNTDSSDIKIPSIPEFFKNKFVQYQDAVVREFDMEKDHEASVSAVTEARIFDVETKHKEYLASLLTEETGAVEDEGPPDYTKLTRAKYQPPTDPRRFDMETAKNAKYTKASTTRKFKLNTRLAETKVSPTNARGFRLSKTKYENQVASAAVRAFDLDKHKADHEDTTAEISTFDIPTTKEEKKHPEKTPRHFKLKPLKEEKKQPDGQVRLYDIGANNDGSKPEDVEFKDLTTLLAENYMDAAEARYYDIDAAAASTYVAPTTPRVFDPSAKLVIQETATVRTWSASS